MIPLYNLGQVPWEVSQLAYHALARMGRRGVFLLAPASPYVCIGYHQDLRQEVDEGYCQVQGIPIFRREVGGGAVYLDGDQLFYQIVLRRDDPGVPSNREALYRKFLEPVAMAYRDLGVEAVYRPVNDVVTASGRKISGNGAAEIGDQIVIVGNIIVDFDYQTMAQVLQVPDEKYRDKVHKTMRDNLTTLKEELGVTPPIDRIVAVLRANFERVLGPMEETTELDPELRMHMERLAGEYMDENWLRRKGRRSQDREVKIATGVVVRQGIHKAPGGLIRATLALKGGTVDSVLFSGDFFFYPKEKLEALEDRLAGIPIEHVEDAIAAFYSEEGIQSPGLTPGDLVRAMPLEGRAI